MMKRLSLFLLLGVLVTVSSAAMAGHKTQHGGHDRHYNSHQGFHHKHQNRHHKHQNRHYKHQNRHHHNYGHGGHYQPPALFSFGYSSHGAAINYRSYPHNGYLYGSVHLHGH